MADPNKPASGAIGKLASSIKDNIGKLYSSTYFTQPTNSRDLAALKKDISDSISAISTNNMDTVGTANISKLYGRIKALDKDSDFKKRIEDVLGDRSSMDDIMQAYMENKYLRDLDSEIDVICKYMPKLLEALDTRKDNVLSADHFSKDFISVANSSTTNNSTFSERIENIKTKYSLLEQAEQWYENAARYGEQFLYIVPYSTALEKLKSKSAISYDAAVVSENGNVVIKEGLTPNTINSVLNSTGASGLRIELNTTGILEEAVMERAKASTKLKIISEQSLCLEHKTFIEQALVEAKSKSEIGFPGIEGKPSKTAEEILGKRKRDMDITIDPNELKVPEGFTQDGLITPKQNRSTDDITNKLNVPGCIVKKLDRALVKPIYMEDICMGYYYIELKAGQEVDFQGNGSIMDPTLNMSRSQMQKQSVEISKQDAMLKSMASQISGFIDDKFINNNIDLSKELYMILKYNDIYNNPTASMKVTYLAPEDVVHIKFREDPKTHRGISDLDRALFPAKIYCCLYITNAIANLTRSFDKRVYYVKQTIDNNIAKTLLTTINQIKKSNFGLRQIENINNVLNITGAFNDFLIPTNSSNDPPINFEIMQGQQINMPTELMATLEEMAVNSTDVALELIQARQSMDYAVQYTMTNSKFLRKVYHRQGQFQAFLSIIVSRIYNYEYNEDIDLVVTLPPPVFLNITNTSQIINNTSDFANAVVEIRMSAETDETVKAIFSKDTKEYYLGSYLDTTMLDKLEEQARQKASIISKEQ